MEVLELTSAERSLAAELLMHYINDVRQLKMIVLMDGAVLSETDIRRFLTCERML